MNKANLKKFFIGITLSLFIFSANAFTIVDHCVPKARQYVYYLTVYDWGCSVDYVVANLGKKYAPEKIAAKDFEVTVAMMAASAKSSRFGRSKGERIVTEAFLSDETGNPVEGESQYVTLVFETGPEVPYVSPFSKSVIKDIHDLYGYKIENDELDFTLYDLAGLVNAPAAKFKTSSFIDDDKNFSYAYYDTPEKAEGTPLLIWLHGITEGGRNPYIPLMEIKSTNLAGNEIQGYFEKGLEVLIPQCPTTWLETTSIDPFGFRIWSPVDLDGMVSKVTNPVYKLMENFTDIPAEPNEGEKIATTSYYTQNLMNLIEAFLESHPYIDKNRIYIGGCSAGGYMTMNMIIEYPDFFAAAIPTCEVYVDNKITDSKIKELSRLPIWFVQAETDTTVKAKTHCVPTVNRLLDAGAKDVRLSLYSGVFDQTGKYKTETGEPYEYSGHLSWHYTLNNDPEINGEKLFHWLSKQFK